MSINIEEAGNPRRKTRNNREKSTSDGEAGRDGPASDGTDENASAGRTKRVAVTPRDPKRLRELADDFGLPKSKVYNMAFQALLEKWGMK